LNKAIFWYFFSVPYKRKRAELKARSEKNETKKYGVSLLRGNAGHSITNLLRASDDGRGLSRTKYEEEMDSHC
jgi:hypothetical protein